MPIVDSGAAKYNKKILSIIHRTEQRGRHQSVFQHFKRALRCFIPTEWDPFFQETHEPFNNIIIVSNKTVRNWLSLADFEAGGLCTGEEIELFPQPSKDRP
jgi:hypothetical protein